MFGLEVRTPRLVLRYPDDEDALALAELGALGVHDADATPFSIQWTSVPPPHQQRNTLAFLWDQRSTAQREDWHLPLVTVVDGEVAARRVCRRCRGPCFARWAPGHGSGGRTRAGASAPRCGPLRWTSRSPASARCAPPPVHGRTTRPSLAVTRRLGYRPNGEVRGVGKGEAVLMRRFAMDRAVWEANRHGDIGLVGAEAVAELFGTERAPGS